MFFLFNTKSVLIHYFSLFMSVNCRLVLIRGMVGPNVDVYVSHST